MTASAPIDRRTRVLAAGGGLALAYLRILAEGDGARASILLGEFQQWWGTYYGTYADDYGHDSMPSVVPTGALDAGSQSALIMALMGLDGVIPGTGAVRVGPGAEAMVAWYRTLAVPGPADGLWGAYTAARGASLPAAGTAARSWAEDTVDGVAGGWGDLLDELTGDETQTAVGMEPSPTFHVPGLVPRAAAKSYWPWAVAGGAALVLGGVLVYKMRKRR